MAAGVGKAVELLTGTDVESLKYRSARFVFVRIGYVHKYDWHEHGTGWEVVYRAPKDSDCKYEQMDSLYRLLVDWRELRKIEYNGHEEGFLLDFTEGLYFVEDTDIWLALTRWNLCITESQRACWQLSPAIHHMLAEEHECRWEAVEKALQMPEKNVAELFAVIEELCLD
jgi:hypothetical protein